MNKTFLRLPALVLMLALCAPVLGGCSGGLKTAWDAVTTGIKNPISKNEMALAESAVITARTGVIAYLMLPTCAAGQVSSILMPCANEAIQRQIGYYDEQVEAQLQNARAFIRDNPNVSASKVIAKLNSAISDFNAVKAKYGLN